MCHVSFLSAVVYAFRRQQPAAQRNLPGLPQGLIRTYEDYVLGKVYSDWTFARASDAVRRYQGRDRARGLADPHSRSAVA